MPPKDSEPVLHGMPQNESFLAGVLIPALIILLVIFAGMGTGWLLLRVSNGSSIAVKDVGNKTGLVGKINEGRKEAGLADRKTFKDQAEGMLEVGGVDGEGSHKLIRTGGASQTVYLTSSVVDLDEFVGKKVEIWGETNKGAVAAWLMDVGYVKVLGE